MKLAICFLPLSLATFAQTNLPPQSDATGAKPSQTPLRVLGNSLQKLHLTEAEKGSAEAQFELGFLYLRGDQGVEQDYGKAREWLTKAAKQNYSQAQFLLAAIYRDGLGTEKNVTEALAWLRLAIQEKSPDNQLSSNQMSIAQFSIGTLLVSGKGSREENFKEAFTSFRKAAELGHALAQTQIGYLYSRGDGVEQDQKEAVKWFEKAANQGHFWGLLSLGFCYKEGEGVPQSYVEAHKWYNLAVAVSGVRSTGRLDSLEKVPALEALRTRDELAKKMTPEQIAEAQARAEKFLSEMKKRNSR